jgi:hypothetical protein
MGAGYPNSSFIFNQFSLFRATELADSEIINRWDPSRPTTPLTRKKKKNRYILHPVSPRVRKSVLYILRPYF